jgi:hypothetical protein
MDYEVLSVNKDKSGRVSNPGGRGDVSHLHLLWSIVSILSNSEGLITYRKDSSIL